MDVLEDVARYKNLLTETAKELWRQHNPARERLPRNFVDALHLKFYEVQDNCATLPLHRQLMVDEQGIMFEQPDELDEAVVLVAQTIEAANLDQPLPSVFPRRLITMFADYGKSLATDEWIEQKPAGWNKSVRYDAVARERLQRFADAAYEDHVDLTGTVTMARVLKPRMEMELIDRSIIEAPFRPEDEAIITTALKEHSTARVRVVGRGLFSGQGLLQRMIEISSVTMLVGGMQSHDPGAKPIWEEFDEILSTVTAGELAMLPTDGAEHHDKYISGVFRAGK